MRYADSAQNQGSRDTNNTDPKKKGKKKSTVSTGDLSNPVFPGENTWTSEVTNRYAFSGDFKSWLAENNDDGFFPDDPAAAWALYQSIYGGQHTAFADGMDRSRNAEKAMAHLKVWYTFFDMSEEVFYVLPGSAFGSLAKGGGRAFGFKGILSTRQKLFYNLNFNTNRGASYFTQDATHRIFPKSSYRATIFEGKMTFRNNGTYGFEFKGSFRRYELGIKPDGTVIHNNSFKLQKWDSNLSNWWK